MRRPTAWTPPDRPTLSGELGVSERKLEGEVERGTVVRLRRGVYIGTSHVPESPRERHLLRALAEQAARPELTAGHETAALAWELPFAGDQVAAECDPVLLLPPGPGHRGRRTATARILVAPLPSDHIATTATGLHVTTCARTAVDVAGVELPTALIPLDAALRAECFRMPGVSRRRDLANPRLQELGRDALLSAAAVEPRLPPLIEAITLADARRETPVESLSAGFMRQAGLPDPIPQAEVPSAIGPLFPDFLWPDWRLIGEVDGTIKYQTQQVMLAEKEREQVLRDLGFGIVRWTGKEIWVTPWQVVERIGRALAAA